MNDTLRQAVTLTFFVSLTEEFSIMWQLSHCQSVHFCILRHLSV